MHNTIPGYDERITSPPDIREQGICSECHRQHVRTAFANFLHDNVITTVRYVNGKQLSFPQVPDEYRADCDRYEDDATVNCRAEDLCADHRDDESDFEEDRIDLDDELTS